MALPTAIFAMIASFALASAAVLSSVDAQQGTKRDHESKEAIAAADAGANMALLRLNRFQSRLTQGAECVGPNGEEQTPTEGWCPSSPIEGVNGASYSYRVSEYKKGTELNVVAVGALGSVSRRVQVGLMSYNEENVFANEGLIGQDSIALEGTAVEIKTNIGTNGEVSSNGHGTICGDLRHGNGRGYPVGQPQCGGDVIEGEKALPEIIVPENIATENSNCRLAVTCPNAWEVDTYTSTSGKTTKEARRTSTNPWDAPNRIINVKNATLTMTGADYFVCGLHMETGQLIMAADKHVRIFVDTPEHCGIKPGVAQVEMKGNANIESTGYNNGESGYSVPEIYVLGNSPVKLTGNAGANELLLYAPNSEVELGGSAKWIGLIAGKSMRLHGSPLVEKYLGPAPEDLTITSLWERTRYVECVGSTGSPPNANC